jgi:hypothetical protein
MVPEIVVRVGGKPPNPDYNVGVASGIMENLQLCDYPVHYDLPAPSLTFEVASLPTSQLQRCGERGEIHGKDGSGVGRRR